MKKKPQLNKEELTMAALAGEFRVTLKVHIEPSKPKPPPKHMTKAMKKRRKFEQEVTERMNKRRDYLQNPYDALTRFDVTVSGQVLDIKMKVRTKNLMISQVRGIVDEAQHQLDWAVRNRIEELNMKTDYEQPFNIPYEGTNE